ncbi:MAG: DUF6364 family protein [Flavobacteriales bacterium]|jgi:hypothetical protein
MDSKLTLKLNQDVIQRAKHYAEAHNISLSRLIENYLQSLTGLGPSSVIITPLVQSLSGIIDEASIVSDKDGYADYLKKKYE